MKISQVRDRVNQLKNFLDTQPDDEVFTGRELETTLGFAICEVSTFKRVRNTRLLLYCEKAPVKGQAQTWLYGNPKAIRALRKIKDK